MSKQIKYNYTNIVLEVEGEEEIEIVDGVWQITIFHELHLNQVNNEKVGKSHSFKTKEYEGK